MILVIGGTGSVGSPVVRALVERGLPTRVLVRRPPEHDTLGSFNRSLQSVDFVVGDADDPGALSSACAGVDQVFVAMANGPRQLEIELAIVREARRAGVSHIVKVSAPLVGEEIPVAIARMHFRVEQEIERTGMQATFLRPYGFMQNLLKAQAEAINHTGMFFGITGDAQMNLVDARDIAAVAVRSLTDPAIRGPLVLTSDRTASYPEIADMLSVTGKRITYVNQRPLTMRRAMKRADLPDWLIEHILEIQGLTLTHPETPTRTVLDVTGRAPRTIEDFLVEYADRFNPPRWTRVAPFHWFASRALGSNHGGGSLAS
ncbi:MAG: NmrA family NAD(P)-binding protein [Nocardioides sp.]